MWPVRRASRRTRRFSARRSNQGIEISQSSATITIVVAARATVTARPSTSAAGRAREEDDATCVAGNLFERADHLRLPPPGRGCDRDGGPHALLELAPELLYQPLVVLLDVDVSFGDHLLAETRTHAEELHRRIMSRRGLRAGRSACHLGTCRRLLRAGREVEDVDGSGAGAQAAQAVADRLARDPFRGSRG